MFGQTFFLFWPAPSGNHGIFSIHMLHGLIQHIGHYLWVILVDGEEELSGLQLVGEHGDQNFVVGFIDQKGLLVKACHI